mmetsp:Transcript_17425/g.39489  ORF Transcript_17425/g.39489 Transcript_17425/m.39489 type:complete len:257 (+) Transcript_17425:537-1307(+)
MIEIVRVDLADIDQEICIINTINFLNFSCIQIVIFRVLYQNSPSLLNPFLLGPYTPLVHHRTVSGHPHRPSPRNKRNLIHHTCHPLLAMLTQQIRQPRHVPRSVQHLVRVQNRRTADRLQSATVVLRQRMRRSPRPLRVFPPPQHLKPWSMKRIFIQSKRQVSQLDQNLCDRSSCSWGSFTSIPGRAVRTDHRAREEQAAPERTPSHPRGTGAQRFHDFNRSPRISRSLPRRRSLGAARSSWDIAQCPHRRIVRPK